MITVQINAKDATGTFAKIESGLNDASPMYQRIASMLEFETEQNFAAQGRPNWIPLSNATKKERLKRNDGATVLKILQDTGMLAKSVSSEFGADFAMIGAGGGAKDYAAAHQFGADIQIPAKSVKTRLRTDRKGNLIRQGESGRSRNLAVFAKDSHKLAQEKWSEVAAHTIRIPARHYLPFTGHVDNSTLQPSAEKKLIEIAAEFLDELTN